MTTRKDIEHFFDMAEEYIKKRGHPAESIINGMYSLINCFYCGTNPHNEITREEDDKRYAEIIDKMTKYYDSGKLSGENMSDFYSDTNGGATLKQTAAHLCTAWIVALAHKDLEPKLGTKEAALKAGCFVTGLEFYCDSRRHVELALHEWKGAGYAWRTLEGHYSEFKKSRHIGTREEFIKDYWDEILLFAQSATDPFPSTLKFKKALSAYESLLAAAENEREKERQDKSLGWWHDSKTSLITGVEIYPDL
ncbi:MAG: hypothetical protein HY052_07240 [Proteobacteria bacterium]|nr:hypothetical protein [Pseudomonadota bacterium]